MKILFYGSQREESIDSLLVHFNVDELQGLELDETDSKVSIKLVDSILMTLRRQIEYYIFETDNLHLSVEELKSFMVEAKMVIIKEFGKGVGIALSFNKPLALATKKRTKGIDATLNEAMGAIFNPYYLYIEDLVYNAISQKNFYVNKIKKSTPLPTWITIRKKSQI